MARSQKNQAVEVTETVTETKPKWDAQAYWTPERKAEMAEKMKAYWAVNEAPMKGRKLSPETIEVIRQKALDRYAAIRAAKA